MELLKIYKSYVAFSVMDFFIKKIFDDKIDESVHLQFQKFSRGNFKNRAMILGKNSKGNYSLSMTYEYANELVKFLAEKTGVEKVNVSGVIVSTADLTGKLKFKSKKQFMGVKQYVISDEMSGLEMKKICDEFPECFMALSFKTPDGTELKIKPKAPKSGKPATKGNDKPKPDFCKLKTSDKDLISGLVFEKTDFKQADITHEFVIESIELPKGVSNPNEIRRLAKRKGKIVREINIDGQVRKEEKKFAA